MEYDWKLTLKKVVINLGIFGIPAFLAYAQAKDLAWALAFSSGLLWIVDYLKHK